MWICYNKSLAELGTEFSEMNKPVFFRRSLSVASGALVISPALFGATSALAIPSTSCGEVIGAYSVGTNICEMRYQDAGSFTFTAPSGVAKMGAIVVGAGGGGVNNSAGDIAYAGGGGEVLYVNLNGLASTEFTVLVGAGGASAFDGDPSSGANSSLTWSETVYARGGEVNPGISGNANSAGIAFGTGIIVTSGGGAGGDGESADSFGTIGQILSGGVGLAPSAARDSNQVLADQTLFPASVGEPTFGVGGSVTNNILPAVVTFNTESGYSNSGFGGAATLGNDAASLAGQDGAIYIRWETPTPAPEQLAETGTDKTAIIFAATGIAFVLAGISFIAGRRNLNPRRSRT